MDKGDPRYASVRERLRAASQRASTLASAPFKVVQASVTPETDMSRRRLEMCRGCENWTGNTCRVCGCFTALKVRLPAEACPIGKWTAER